MNERKKGWRKNKLQSVKPLCFVVYKCWKLHMIFSLEEILAFVTGVYN